MNPRIGGTARSLIGLAAVVAALSSVAPAFSNRISPVRNQPGERLWPPPPRRPRRPGPDDLSKLQAAAEKRDRRNWRNSYNLAHGGWASTQSCLNRLARIEAAKLQ